MISVIAVRVFVSIINIYSSQPRWQRNIEQQCAIFSASIFYKLFGAVWLYPPLTHDPSHLLSSSFSRSKLLKTAQKCSSHISRFLQPISRTYTGRREPSLSSQKRAQLPQLPSSLSNLQISKKSQIAKLPARISKILRMLLLILALRQMILYSVRVLLPHWPRPAVKMYRAWNIGFWFWCGESRISSFLTLKGSKNLWQCRAFCWTLNPGAALSPKSCPAPRRLILNLVGASPSISHPGSALWRQSGSACQGRWRWRGWGWSVPAKVKSELGKWTSRAPLGPVWSKVKSGRWKWAKTEAKH